MSRSTLVVHGPLAIRMRRLAADAKEILDVKFLPFRLSRPVSPVGL